MGQRRASHPRFRREGAPPHVALTDDDLAVLRCVYRHRFVRADDLYRLFANRSPDRLSRRLTLLFRAEFLDRPIAQVDRYKEGGSRPLVYGLGNAGARYLKEKLGTPIGATDWRSRNRSYTRENLDHTLAVSKFLIDVELECRARGDLQFIPFEEILARSPEATRRSPNPASWPVPVQWHGAKSVVHIAPDAIFGLRLKHPDEKPRAAYFFLEVDRGTMTIVPSERVQECDAFPYRATIVRKLLAYADSHRLNVHERRFGFKAPRVLLVTTNERRAALMRRALADHVMTQANLPAGLFVIQSEARPILANLVGN